MYDTPGPACGRGLFQQPRGIGNKIFVGRLPQEATTEYLRHYFPKDPKRSGHRGFGFVTFADDGVADRVSRRSHEILGQEEEANLFIFLELVTQGSLASLYQRYHLRDSQVSAYTRQILSGLKYLHDRNVVHRDIKCTNILVHANGSIKLADFGLAKESCKGSVYWMAPEVIQPKKTYGSAADIWSLGCTVLEMLTRQVPYPNLEWTQALFRIGRGEKPVIPDSLSSDARDFISLCVQVNPDDRPTAAQLLDHAFVKRLMPAYSSDGSSHGIGR